MEDIVEDIALLKRISFFNDLSSTELMEINKVTERAVYRQGEVVVKEGTACDAFYIIKEGTVKVVTDGRDIVTIENGEPIGELSFIDKGLRSATVIALENTVLIKISSDKFTELMEKDKDLSSKFYRAIALVLCSRLRDTNNVLALIRD